MYELPEARIVSAQIKSALSSKQVIDVEINHDPHKFAFFNHPHADYRDLLLNKRVIDAYSYSSRIVILFEDVEFLVWDGARMHYHESNLDKPIKRQFRLTFSERDAIYITVQMYGGIEVWQKGDEENKYLIAAKTKPNPLSDAFTYAYFESLFIEETLNLSLKAFLATNQRIPGLGNGVLQDLLFYAGLHPKRKVGSLNESERLNLFASIVRELNLMVEMGGRDSEADLFGAYGNYKTLASRFKQNEVCPICGGHFIKESYLGGAIYYCPKCQK